METQQLVLSFGACLVGAVLGVSARVISRQLQSRPAGFIGLSVGLAFIAFLLFLSLLQLSVPASPFVAGLVSAAYAYVMAVTGIFTRVFAVRIEH